MEGQTKTEGELRRVGKEERKGNRRGKETRK